MPMVTPHPISTLAEERRLPGLFARAGLEMVSVPAGVFGMGEDHVHVARGPDASPEGRLLLRESPRHPVELGA